MGTPHHTKLTVVDARTKRRVCAIIGRVGVTRAKILLGVSEHTFDALRFNGAMRGYVLARIVATLDAVEGREEAAQ